MAIKLSDEFNTDDLDGNDFGESWDNKELFGPLKACGEYLPVDKVPEPQLDKPLGGHFTPRLEVLSRSDFRCVRCKVDCRESPDLLEAHHPDRDLSTNLPEHLMALCVSCHAEMPGHSFMFSKRDPRVFARLDDMRRIQGISWRITDPSPEAQARALAEAIRAHRLSKGK